MLNLFRENDFRKFIHLQKSFSKVDSFPYKIYRETLLILFKLEKKKLELDTFLGIIILIEIREEGKYNMHSLPLIYYSKSINEKKSYK